MNKLFIFDRCSTCILNKEWETNDTASSPASSIGKNSTSSGRSTIEIGLEEAPTESSVQEFTKPIPSSQLVVKETVKSKAKGSSFISEFLPSITKSFSKLAFSDANKGKLSVENQPQNSSDESQSSKNLLTIREHVVSSEEAKLVFGLVYTLANISKKLSQNGESFYCYKTASYVLYHLETVTSYRFVFLADFNSVFASVGKELLEKVYKGPFMEYVTRNPLQPIEKQVIGAENEKFHRELNKLITKYV